MIQQDPTAETAHTDPASQQATAPEMIQVEVAYALPQQQWLLTVTLPSDATVHDAIRASGIQQQVPDLVVDDDNVGIFSQKTRLNAPLKSGDRVEIYRPLIIDPKENRRRRAQTD